MGAQTLRNLVFIIGEGHSGSTLLARMLDRHPAIFCPGELLRLDQTLLPGAESCSCALPVPDCSTWQRWLKQLPQGALSDYRTWTMHSLDRFREAEGQPVLLDSSKSRAYRLTKSWKDSRLGHLLILRDPRGVLCSDLRRGADLAKELKTHRKWIERYETFAARRGTGCLTVYYEDLVTSPESELRRACDFIGIPFDPASLATGPYPHHFVRASTSSFLKGPPRLRLDERWREELTPGQVRTICASLEGISCYRRYQLASN